jgi:hypothetical protein
MPRARPDVDGQAPQLLPGRFVLLDSSDVPAEETGRRYAWAGLFGPGVEADVYAIPKLALAAGWSLKRALAEVLPTAWRFAAEGGLPAQSTARKNAKVRAVWDPDAQRLEVTALRWHPRGWL